MRYGNIELDLTDGIAINLGDVQFDVYHDVIHLYTGGYDMSCIAFYNSHYLRELIKCVSSGGMVTEDMFADCDIMIKYLQLMDASEPIGEYITTYYDITNFLSIFQDNVTVKTHYSYLMLTCGDVRIRIINKNNVSYRDTEHAKGIIATYRKLNPFVNVKSANKK